MAKGSGRKRRSRQVQHEKHNDRGRSYLSPLDSWPARRSSTWKHGVTNLSWDNAMKEQSCAGPVINFTMAKAA